MRSLLRGVCAFAFLAASTLATPASAATVLQFSQLNPADFVTATNSAGVTTLTSSSTVSSVSIPVSISNIGGVPQPVVIPAFETFTGLHSVGTATTDASGLISQVFTGTIAITSAAAGAGTNYLTATFTDVLSGPTNTGAPTLSADSSVAGETVTFTSNDPRVTPLLPGLSRNFSLAFSNATPALSISGGSIASFTGQQTGTFAVTPSPTVPEPASVVMASIAAVAGIGSFGWRRFKASRA
jgi:hypothetical protein